MKSLSDTFLGKGLGVLAKLVTRHRWLFLWPQFLLFGLCVIYTVKYIQFDTDRDNLVGSNKKYNQYFQQYKKEFPAQDDLVVVVESENSEKNRQFVERLGRKLEVETNTFTDVFYKGDLSMMGRKALLFADESDLRDMSGSLKDYLPFIQKFSRATNLTSMFNIVNSEIYHAKREQNSDNDALLKAIPMLKRIVQQADSSLHHPGEPPSPGIYALFGNGEEAEQAIYITFNKGGRHIYLVTARAKTDALNSDAVDRLRFLVSQTVAEVPGINVGITGEPVLENDEMAQSQTDSTRASIISLVICALIFIYGYQQTGRPLKATLCLLVGLGYTMAFTTFAVGHLNILTITFVPILIGLAIDFGVHLITRYEEELRLGKSEEESMRMAIVFTGQGILTGAMTTAVAFLAMGLTNFKGIQEMGVICGGGMILCFIPMMTLLPVMLFRGKGQNTIDAHVAEENHVEHGTNLRTRIESLWLKRPLLVTLLTLAVTAVAASFFHRVYFDYNLLHMQSDGLPAVVYEEKLIDSTPQSVLFCAVVVNTPQEAVVMEKRLAALPAVGTNISIAHFLVGDADEKLRLVGDIKKQVGPIEFGQPDSANVSLSQLSATLYSTSGYMGAAAAAVIEDERQSALTNNLVLTNGDPAAIPQTVTNSEPKLSEQLLGLKDAISVLRKDMLSMDEHAASAKLASYQAAFFNDIRTTFQSIRDQDNSSGLHISDLPGPLRNRFIGVNGKVMIQVYPKKDVWNHEFQKEFVEQVRSVCPEVTGTPVQLLEYTSLLRQSYIEAAYYSLFFIVIMVLVHFRSLTYLLLALLPVAIGSAWMGGLMGIFGIPFNPANIMTLPLVIGIGVTNGIHILNRFVEEGNPSILSKSTGKAVFVSGLTTIAGFGSLIPAQHQGIRSLGLVMSIGVALCMVAALAFLPAVLTLMGNRLKKSEKQQPSGDNAQPPLSREEPR